MTDVYEFIENLKIKNKTVVVAVSGGMDSMFLLHVLIKLRSKLKIRIIVAHVHHNIRKESDEEALQVEKFSKDNNIIFELMKIEKYPKNKFSEEAARKRRYDFFDKVVRKYNADILFTAHHGDDMIETVLMRITRGSSLKGYAGFERINRDRGYIIARPLIFLTKDQIKLEMVKSKGWYAEDLSNKDESYTRNRYRQKILPQLKNENKNVHCKFNEFNDKLLMAHGYIKKQADFIYDDIVKDGGMDANKFNKLDKIIKIYLLEKYLKKIYKDEISKVTDKHTQRIIGLLLSNNNATLDLPNNKTAIIEYNKFKVIEKTVINNYEYILDEQIVLPNKKRIYIDNETKITTNFVIHLNKKELHLPLHVRNKRDGDTMTVKNMLGKKKINDIFTNFKLPKELRDTYPLVTDDKGEIIWIPGIKKSHFDRKKEQKYDIILRYD